MKPVNRILLSLIPLVASTLTSAVYAAEDWYQVDMIVFLRGSSADKENWPESEEEPSLAGTIDPDAPTAGRSRPVLPDGSVAYRGTASDQLREEYKKLNGSKGRFEPMINISWKQPVGDRDKASKVALKSQSLAPGGSSGFGTPPHRVIGTAAVSKNRYLHLELDLALNRIAPPSARSDYSATGYNSSLRNARYQTIRMSEHRRMRSGELHYLDHPLMGALVKITPIDVPAEPAPEQTEPAATETAPAPN